MKISFILRKDSAGPKKPVYLHVIKSRTERTKIKLDIRVEEKYWDTSGQRVKAGHPQRSEINVYISEMESKAFSVITSSAGKSFSELSQKLSLILSGNSSHWNDTWEKFVNAQSSIVSDLTIKKYNTVRDLLNESKITLDFQAFSQSWIDQWCTFLMDKGYMNDTAARYIGIVKTFIRWSFERAHHNNSAFLSVKSDIKKMSRHDIVTLTYSELITYLNHPLTGMEAKARDLFCFAAFTGARLSDVQSFRRDDANMERWQFEPYKTRKMKKVVTIPFTGYFAHARDILIRNNWKLPQLNDQNCNSSLKTGLEKAGINTPVRVTNLSGKNFVVKDGPKYRFITMRSARATCASILINEFGIPVTIVQKQVLAHSKIETTMKYENNSPEQLIAAMNKVQIK